MAELNVFDMTTSLKALHEQEEKAQSNKTVNESVSRDKKSDLPKIPCSKLKVESITRFIEAEGDEAEEFTADYTPADDVVLVIDPEMEEVPEDPEEAEKEAEELVGQHVCKCSICGANYVCDGELDEDLDVEDEECPVCGETGEQIVVGVITPAEELSTEDEEDVVDVDAEEVEETEDGEDVEDFDFEEDEEEDDDFEESVKRSRARTLRRRAESVRRPSARRPMRKPMPKKPVAEDLGFDEITFNRMMTTFAKENYDNVRFVKISKGTVRGKRLTLEGVVTTTKGSKRPIKFVCENFVPAQRMTLEFTEKGPFTESIKGQKATFVVECVKRGKDIKPVALKYDFKSKNYSGVRESKSTYSVTGRVLSESVRRPRKRK